MLAESVEDAMTRERSSFDLAAQGRADRIVLFGAGGLGRRMARHLRAEGIEPLAVADNNEARWGTDFEGLTVLSPAEAAARFGGSAVFVVTIWGAGTTHRLRETLDQLASIGCDVAVPFAWLAWRHPDRMLPHYAVNLPSRLLAEAGAVRAAYDLLSDDDSREEYVDQIGWRLTGDPSGLSHPVEAPQYLVDDVAQPSNEESFLDCGAYDGDTLESWLVKRGPTFSRYIALEPDASNRERLEQLIGTLDPSVAARIDVHEYAVTAKTGTVVFDASGNAAAAAHSLTGLEETIEVPGIRIDELVERLGTPKPTFIKMDIEGGEPGAVAGAAPFIAEERPLLALCVYHRQNHLWRIPLQVAEIVHDYRYYLRPHNEEGWDLVLYAVPPARALSN